MISALHTYVLVAQDRREVTIFRRTSERWLSEELPDNGEALRILELAFVHSLDAVYARTGL